MLPAVKILIGDLVLEAEFFETPCAQAVVAALPIEARPNEWGDEFYFEVPVDLPPDETATVRVKAGDIGTLTFYPIPDQSYTLFFRSDEGFTQFTYLTDIALFPDEYQEALVYNLARRIWNKYHNERTDPFPQDMKTIANEALQTIADMNFEDMPVGMDVPTSGRSKGIYDILSDSYR